MRGMQLAKTSRNRTQRFAATSVAFGSARFGNGAGTTALNGLTLEVRDSIRDGLARELRRSDLKSIRAAALSRINFDHDDSIELNKEHHCGLIRRMRASNGMLKCSDFHR